MHRSRVRWKRSTVALVGALTMLLTSCGGDDGSGTKTGSPTTTITVDESTPPTDATNTTAAAEVGETTTTLDSTESTLSGSTPTTAGRSTATTTTLKNRRTTTTVGRGSGGSSTTVAGEQVSKGTVKLGTFGITLNTATGARTVEEGRKIAQAWEEQVNRQGGINGYKVDVIYRDTGGDSAKALAVVKELDQLGVLAIVGPTDVTRIPSILPYINQKKLPILGGPALTPEYDSDPMLFAVNTNYYGAVYGGMTTAKDAGAKSVRLIWAQESPQSQASIPINREAAAREGIKFSDQGASLTAVDYTPQCLSARDAGADTIRLSAIDAANFVRDCQRQGYHPMYLVGVNITNATIDAVKGERLAGSLQEIPTFYRGPEADRFRKALAMTDLQEGQYTQSAPNTWVSFEMAGAVLKKLNQSSPTRADFLNAMYTIKGETLGGQNQPVDYTTQKDGKHQWNDCWLEVILTDGKKLSVMDKNGQAVPNMTWTCGTGKAP